MTEYVGTKCFRVPVAGVTQPWVPPFRCGTNTLEGEVDRQLQQLTEAAGAFLSPAKVEDAVKAAGWSADERADALRGQGLRYREAR